MPLFTEEETRNEPMLRWFEYEHLQGRLRETSSWFATMAATIARELPRTPERTVALRKLLESKDAAVRVAIEGIELLKARAAQNMKGEGS